MKKSLCLILFMLFMFSSCTYGGNYGGKVSDVKTKKVDSKVYSQEDIASAIDTIKALNIYITSSQTIHKRQVKTKNLLH